MSGVAFRLPVSGIEVELRPPCGRDDLFLREAGTPGGAVALAFLAGVAERAGGGALEVAALPVGDVDFLLLRLRQALIGDTISGEARCAVTECRERVDVTFRVETYLEHHRTSPAPVAAGDEPGWLRLRDTGIQFRAPTAGDQLAIARDPDPEDALLRRCVRPAEITAPEREEVESAMEAIAPTLFAELEGRCPACGAAVRTSFDPIAYVLRELRDRAAFVYEEVAAIARSFHWAEAEILALPASRRARYAEMAMELASTRA